MKTFSRLIYRALLIVLLVTALPTVLHAEKRIGVIMTGDIPYYGAMHEAFIAEFDRMTAGGEKVEIILQRPFPDSISWSNAARKLIAFDVDLVVTYGSPATNAFIHEKSRIPLVYAGLYDPESLLPVGKNATGCGFKVPLSSIVRYLKRIKPIDTIGIVFSGIEEDSVRQFTAMNELAGQLGMKVDKIDIRSRDDLNKLTNNEQDAVFLTGSSIVHLWIDDILAILRKKMIPVADIFPDSSEAGVLMALYQPPHLQGQMAAVMATQILRGEGPRSIAPHVSRDTELEFNLIEARHLNITIPVNVVIEATRVIK
ncbi:MAG: ABC transporter substrate binding protein [Pseudomonadota bacterium]